MKLLLTSGGVTNPSIHSALVQLLGKPIARVPRPARPDGAVGSPDVRPGVGAGPGRRRARLPALLRPGLGVARCPRAHRTAHHRRGALGALGPGGRRAPGRRRRRDVPVPLDAGVRAGRSAAFAARHGVGGGERRKHGDDAPDRGRTSSSGRPRRTTAPWGSSTSRSSRTWTPFPTNTLADAERWAADIGVPAYAIDEQTAIKVVDGCRRGGLRRAVDEVRVIARTSCVNAALLDLTSPTGRTAACAR